MKKFIYVVFILGVITSGILISCKRTSHSSDYMQGTPETGDWVVIRLLSEPDGLNPLTSVSSDAQEIDGMLLYESLIGTDNNTLLDMPVLADSLPEISSDHLHYTYHLKKNATFSDGVGVTGNDLICFMKSVKNPLIVNAAPLRGYYEDVQKVELVNNDPYTIEFTMREPYFLASQFCGGVLALPKHIWDPNNLLDKISWEELNNPEQASKDPNVKEYADFFADPSKERDPKFLIGSGKYIYDSWETGSRITFHRNPNYWNAADKKNGNAWLDKIIYKIINDENATITSLKSGEIDFIPNVPKMLFIHAFDSTKDKNIATQLYDYPNMSYIMWNLHNPLFQDVRVRLALAKLVNNEEIIKTMLKGMARPITGTEFFHRPEYDTTIQPVTYDPEGAQKLLADAGWKPGSDGILTKDGKKFEFSLMIPSSPTFQQIALIPVQSMHKAGIIIDLQQLESSVFIQNQRSHRFDAAYSGWSTSTQEGDEYQLWQSGQTEGGSNFGYYHNAQVDSLIQTDRQEFDFNKRVEIHKQIQRLIFNDQPYAFLYSVKLAGAWNNRLHNVHFYAPRPCYDATEWYVPKGAQKYGNQAASK
ncbi:MAG TPA: ABC transporter substrate-binding protein [Candidatus Kapabacteria bacterium]|nr:ABC transporter substrate-binding protein [Candidatus Kapabacteria bacterium]